MTTGFLSHELYMWHNTGGYAGIMPDGNPVQPDAHAEHPETKRRIRNLLEVSGLLDSLHVLKPEPATEEQLLRFHTPEHLANIKAISEGFGGDAGGFTVLGKGGYDIAVLSAGGVVAAMEAVLAGEVSNAYALVRPPGHHALPDEALGFCVFGNAVIAGMQALEVHGLQKIAYVDWDVHHGNSQQTAFYSDPRALTISVHQDNCFPPDSGHLADNGEGDGLGYNINIPLPPGCGVGAYEAAFDQVVLPALDRFQPEMLFVPSGFDAGAYDPLGRMMMHSEGYRSLTRKLMDAADRLCGGKLVCSHEGGYNAHTVPFYGLAVLEQLSGVRTGVEDPFLPIMAGLGGQELQPHQQAVIDQAKAALGRLS
jgi:acetoin utilization deacetylase AcuC-like enzyme